MSDFDTVLERLLIDPAFRAALAADPAGALAGYRLSADELDLLRSQVSVGDGADRTVEARTSKAGVFGLLSPIGGLGGGGAGAEAGNSVGHAGFAAVTHSLAADAGQDSASQHVGESFGPQIPAGFGPGGAEAFGPVVHEGFGPVVHEGFGPVVHEGFGPVVHEGFGPVSHEGFGPVSHEGFGPVEGGGSAAEQAPEVTGGAVQHLGPAVGQPVGAEAPATDALPAGTGDHVAAGYHPQIDADGDGKWDHYVAIQHSDGSVDVYADRNHDGIVDFDGHDRNADGVLDSADYDENFDGVADTHMADVNGDGWMDTRTPIPPPAG